MNLNIIIALIGGLGIGTIFSRFFEVVILQKVSLNREKQKWIFEKKHEAYTNLIVEIRSLGLGTGSTKDIFDFLALSTPSIVLTTNEEISEKIDTFIIDLSKYVDYTQSEKSKEKIKDKNGKPIIYEGEPLTFGDMEITNLQKKGKELVKILRDDLLSKQ